MSRTKRHNLLRQTLWLGGIQPDCGISTFFIVLLVLLSVTDAIVAQTDTIIVSANHDTLRVRQTPSQWRFGASASAGFGASSGALFLRGDVNNQGIRKEFTGKSFGDAGAWNLVLESSWQPISDAVRFGGRFGFHRQSARLHHTPDNNSLPSIISPDNTQYQALRSAVTAESLETGFFVQSSDIFAAISSRLSAFARLDALWNLRAEAQTLYVPASASNIAVTPAPSIETVSMPIVALGMSVGVRYTLRPSQSAFATNHITPFFALHWQPLLSFAHNSSWGVFGLRLGISYAIEPFRADTLAVQPLIRPIPIALLPQTPLSDVIREDGAVTGRIATPREGKDAILEERIVIYRPDDSALVATIPREGLEIIRQAIPLLRSGAHCRLVVILPASVSAAQRTDAETMLRILGDYCLQRGVENSSIEAGLGENRYQSGEAWQLRIRIERKVR